MGRGRNWQTKGLHEKGDLNFENILGWWISRDVCKRKRERTLPSNARLAKTIFLLLFGAYREIRYFKHSEGE